MAISEAKKKADEKWKKENVKRYSLLVRNDLHERIMKRIEITGESKNGFIIQAIREKLERETTQTGNQNEK